MTLGSVLAVLCLSANTSFVDFPRLAHLVAKDGFLPRPFAVPGHRLVYSVGVIFLAAGAGALLIAFGGVTDRLIPLFAVGAFLSFTLSQTGMAMHWWREFRRTGRGSSILHAKLAINGLGALATGTALLVILAAKFIAGAWLTVMVVPLAVFVLRAVRRYYDEIDRQVLRGSERQIDLRHREPPVIVVPIKRWDRLAKKAVEYALSLSPDVAVLHATELEGADAAGNEDQLRASWREFVERPSVKAHIRAPDLEFVSSDFRSMMALLLRAIKERQRRFPHRTITIVLPELVEGRWWGYVMHTNRERRWRASLLRHGGSNIVVTSVPGQLQPCESDRAIAAEEPSHQIEERVRAL